MVKAVGQHPSKHIQILSIAFYLAQPTGDGAVRTRAVSLVDTFRGVPVVWLPNKASELYGTITVTAAKFRRVSTLKCTE